MPLWLVLIPLFALAAVPIFSSPPVAKIYGHRGYVVAVHLETGRWGVFEKRVGLDVRQSGAVRWGAITSPTDRSRLLLWLADEAAPPRNLELLAAGDSRTPEADAEAWIAGHEGA